MNILTVKFDGFTKIQSCPLYQYDYGQILKFADLDLPFSYEVQFAPEGAATSVTSIGDADGVPIPDEVLQTAGILNAYLFLHTGEDDGETEYRVMIPVLCRAEPSNREPTPVEQDVITQTIAHLDAAVEAAEAAAASIPDTVLLYSEQELTDEEQAQARANISAVGVDDVPANAVLYTEQTLTNAQKAQARQNIGAISSADIPAIKDIYWVTYQRTTANEIYTALTNGKYPVVYYYNSESGVKMIAPMTYYFNSRYVFESLDGREYIQFRLTEGTWSLTRLRDHTVKYEAQSLSASEKAQARTNIGAISSADIPDVDGIYWVTYGSTTFAEISQAVADGKYPIIPFRFGNSPYTFMVLKSSEMSGGQQSKWIFAYDVFGYQAQTYVDANGWGQMTYSELATVATSGSYNDLSNRPALKTVATSGSYSDLTNKPTIPTVVSSVTSGGTDAVNSVAVIAYINSLDASQEEY